MKKTEVKCHDGSSTGTNWMLDEVIETLKKYGIDNDEMIKELAIQKINYGKICITEMYVRIEQKQYTPVEFFNYLKSELEKRIEEIKKM